MPRSFTIGEVLSIIRSKLNLRREQGLVLVVCGKYMLKANAILSDIYDIYKDQDGFLYLIYAEENIYGWSINMTE